MTDHITVETGPIGPGCCSGATWSSVRSTSARALDAEAGGVVNLDVATADLSFHSSVSPAVGVTADGRTCRPASPISVQTAGASADREATCCVSVLLVGVTARVGAVSGANRFVSEFFLVGATAGVGAAGGVVTGVSGGG